MGKVENEAFYLYDGFRKYVPKKKLLDYENEFMSRKSYSVKFMTAFIKKYVNFRYYTKNLKDPSDGYLFNFFLIEFSERYSKTSKAIRDFKDTRRTIDRNFMYRNAHPYK